MKFYGL